MAVSKLLEINIILSDNILQLKNIKIYTNFTSTFKLCIHSKQMIHDSNAFFDITVTDERKI